MRVGEHASGPMSRNRDQSVSGVGRSNDLYRLAHVQDADLASGPDCGKRCRRACLLNGECRFARSDSDRARVRTDAPSIWLGFGRLDA
jgi:hypothetical protein